MRRITTSTILLISLLNCTTVPDKPVCRPLETRKQTVDIPDIGKIVIDRPNPKCVKAIGEVRCGYCEWTVSNKHQYVGESEKNHLYKKPWSQVQREAVVTPIESYASFKEYVVNECKEQEKCGEVKDWRVKLDSFDSIGDAFEDSFEKNISLP